MNEFTITKFDYDGIALSVTGERDEDDCYITKITAAGSSVDIFDLIPTRTVEAMAIRAELILDRQDREHNDEMRIERHQWEREFRVAA